MPITAKLTRIGDDVALVLEKPLLDHLGLDENSEVELSIDERVLVITPAMDKIARKYAGVFRRLSKS